jgi:DNA-binding transcriptional MerR regulator
MTGDGGLVTTTEAAKRLGIAARTLQRYVAAGLITPDLTLPSGRYRWDVDKLRDQINAIPRRTEQEDTEDD